MQTRLDSMILILMCSYASIAQTMIVKDCGQKAFPGKIPPGNYSGITHVGGDEYAVVSDKSATDGFFLFRIDVDSVSGEIKNVENLGFRGDSLKNADCEGIAYRPSSGTFFISRECDNVISEYDSIGKNTGRKMNVPDVYKKCAGNYGFESLAYDEESHLFWTINESTLNGDGECATSLNHVRNVLRLQSFDDNLQPVSQYAYIMDAPMADKKSSNYAMGVSEIAALGSGRLLVLEREFFVPSLKFGAFVRCKLYEIEPGKSEPIPSGGDIGANTKFVDKRLVYSFVTRLTLLDWSVANYEGMCLGPKLVDGSRVLILVSDSQDNYGGVLKDWFRTIIIR